MNCGSRGTTAGGNARDSTGVIRDTDTSYSTGTASTRPARPATRVAPQVPQLRLIDHPPAPDPDLKGREHRESHGQEHGERRGEVDSSLPPPELIEVKGGKIGGVGTGDERERESLHRHHDSGQQNAEGHGPQQRLGNPAEPGPRTGAVEHRGVPEHAWNAVEPREERRHLISDLQYRGDRDQRPERGPWRSE